MKKKIFMVCAALVVSAAAVVGVKAYNYYSMPELMRANLEALSQSETGKKTACFSKIKYKAGCYTFYCGECKEVENSTPTFLSPSDFCYIYK